VHRLPELLPLPPLRSGLRRSTWACHSPAAVPHDEESPLGTSIRSGDTTLGISGLMYFLMAYTQMPV
jgi:hypothetical protein